MRISKTLISGVVAAVAVAGSANAAIVTGPSLYSDCATFNPSTPTTVTWNFSSYPGTESEPWGNGASFYFGFKFSAFANGGSSIAFSNVQYSLDAGATWSNYGSGTLNVTSAQTYGVTTAVNSTRSIKDFRMKATIPSTTILTLGSGTGGIGGSNLVARVVTSLPSFSDPVWVSTGTYAVPAPGALALLGVAGVVGARRRR